jgi:hypothetical protein
LATIDETVELTSNPAPLVGDPKLKPTVPMCGSLETSCSRIPKGYRAGLKKTHGAACPELPLNRLKLQPNSPGPQRKKGAREDALPGNRRVAVVDDPGEEESSPEITLLQQLGDFLLHAVGLGQG